ncbi:MAG: serine hydroxymethyltransferase [Brevinema sp.]
MLYQELQKKDPDLYQAICNELKRQQYTIELIASENIVSDSVLSVQGSILTNKYAEGYPLARYYGGCEYVDIAESLAIDRAKKLFNAEHANVQTHSGSQANMAVYMALLKPGDKILGMGLAAGGHLTHGFSLNFSGQLYEAFAYQVNPDTHLLDYNEIRKQALEIRPRLIIAGASAYSRIIDFQEFRNIADEVGAYFMVDMAHIAGLVATGLHPNPVPIADVVTSTTHKTLRGPRGGLILCKEEFAKSIDKMVFPGIQGGPLMHVIAAKAVAFQEALQDDFKCYQQQVVKNAQIMANTLTSLGYSIIGGGTDNHLLIVDVRSHNTNGKEVSNLCDQVHITLNKNAIPFDPNPPMRPSGIRIGTPAITTRGMKEEECVRIVCWIDRVIQSRMDRQELEKIKQEIISLCEKFPIYN